jgi:hypothetical protein
MKSAIYICPIAQNQIILDSCGSADKVYDIIAEEEEATQILNVVAESIVQYKRKSNKV